MDTINATVTSNVEELQKLLSEATKLAENLNNKLKAISNFKLEIGTEKIDACPAREGYVDIKEFSKKLYSEIFKTLVNTE